MFQRLSSLLFGEVEDVSAELRGPNPCVSDADEEGWLLVSLPGEGGAEAPSIAQSLPDAEDCPMADTGSEPQSTLLHSTTPTVQPSSSASSSRPSGSRRRTKASRARAAAVSAAATVTAVVVDPSSQPHHPHPHPPLPTSTSSSSSSSPTPHPASSSSSRSSAGLVGVSGAPLPSSSSSVRRRPRGSAPVSPGSWSNCSGGSGSSGGLERLCGMDESWFVTPPPCFTAEGATAEASPMEDLLIEHPSMSVYVSPGNLSMVEESAGSLPTSVRMSESASAATLPAPRASLPPRVTRGAAAQAGALTKVTQVARVQRSKSRVERRQLARTRMQRQNRAREQVPRHAAHARKSFLHQPCQRNFCH
ncbi:uncharacterized protein LOC134456797 isoform X2 [Engraulis encrasicolus]|uniref:uncharacterized protein LOC134456797 isoform X2 n=1 Tax=Engraulis encrasicolus TaxID=184585 RepID=UPI002FD0A136